MGLDTKSHLGKTDWFWNYLETTPDVPFGLEKIASKQGVDNFSAIQTVFLDARKMNWRPWSSAMVTTPIVEELANVFLNHHATIPYIGRSVRSEMPIYCLEGSNENLTSRFAQWGNGAIYSIKDDEGNGVYVLFVDKQVAETYGYPDMKQIQEEVGPKPEEKEEE